MISLIPFARRLCLALFAFLIAWLIGFIIFIATLPKHPSDTQHIADAIVVLTGGKGRVEVGIALFDTGLGKRLFISGVFKGVNAKTLASKQDVPNALYTRLSDMELGYEANNTVQNAIETAKWAKENNIKSIRLVTGNYHIRRSIIEFKRMLPDVTVIGHPVPFKHIMSRKAIWLMWNEYLKLNYVWAQGVFS